MGGTELQNNKPLRGNTQTVSKMGLMSVNQTTHKISQRTQTSSKGYILHVFYVRNHICP